MACCLSACLSVDALLLRASCSLSPAGVPSDARQVSRRRRLLFSANLRVNRSRDRKVPAFVSRCVGVSPLIGVFAAGNHWREQTTFLARATTEQSTSDQLQRMDESGDEVCELVSGLELTLGEGDDAIDAYLIKAIKNNNGAAVLLLTDVYGYKDNDTRDFAYRFACFGYNVLVPDLFHGEPWNKEIPMSKFEEWRAKHPPERVFKDIDIASSWLSEEIAAAGVSKKLGLIGFCFGGGRVLEALAKDAGRQFAAAVFFYGTRFDPSLATEIKVPVLFITGDKDELCAVDIVQQVASQIDGSQTRIYPGRGHAFAHRPGSAEEDEDAEDAFIAMRSWLNNNLLSSAE